MHKGRFTNLFKVGQILPLVMVFHRCLKVSSHWRTPEFFSEFCDESVSEGFEPCADRTLSQCSLKLVLFQLVLKTPYAVKC